MNIEEYGDKVGLGLYNEAPHCIYCDAPLFYKDLCIEHTQRLMIKLGVVSSVFVADSDITKFLDEAINESAIQNRIDTVNVSINHLHNVDKMTIEQVANALNVSKAYVQRVLG